MNLALQKSSKELQYPETWDKIATTVNDIMNKHKNEKGIIHVTTYKQLEFIKNNISEDNRDRLIETKSGMQGDERAMVIKKHKKSTVSLASVLISPSLIMGLDLKDEESRFQIVVKMPYGDLNDRRINAKMCKNNGWYNWNTLLRLIQACGRSIRSKDDYAATYILD